MSPASAVGAVMPISATDATAAANKPAADFSAAAGEPLTRIFPILPEERQTKTRPPGRLLVCVALPQPRVRMHPPHSPAEAMCSVERISGRAWVEQEESRGRGD